MKTIQEILKPIQADFEEWYEKIYIEDYPVWLDMSIQDFYATCADFQIGVLLRYFRERWGVKISIMWYEGKHNLIFWYPAIWSEHGEMRGFNYATHKEASIEAIKKAVELVK